MTRKKKIIIELGSFVAAIVVVMLAANFLMKPARSILGTYKQDNHAKQENLNYVALGDSLTEGVGDSTKSGGFIPIVASEIQDKYDFKVNADNFGVSGNTSNQIMNRLTKQKKIQSAIKKANFITITVGGNDVLKVIRENLVDLKVSTFKKPLVSYKSRIQEMMLDIRVLNPDAPIYVLGIYNPFYLNFPDLTAMQNIIDNWNAGTKDVVSGTENAYFIPINDLLYKGIDGKEAVDNQTSASTNSSTSEKKTTESSTIPSDPPETVTNDALYEGDQFHPNNLGYQIMAGAVFNEMVRTEAKWNK